MAAWYEEAVFYHIYPIGMTGAPRENREEKVVHRFEILNDWIPHVAELGCTAIYIGPLLNPLLTGMTPEIIKKWTGDWETMRTSQNL